MVNWLAATEHRNLFVGNILFIFALNLSLVVLTMNFKSVSSVLNNRLLAEYCFMKKLLENYPGIIISYVA
jgi:hypothetical protein